MYIHVSSDIILCYKSYLVTLTSYDCAIAKLQPVLKKNKLQSALCAISVQFLWSHLIIQRNLSSQTLAQLIIQQLRRYYYYYYYYY